MPMHARSAEMPTTATRRGHAIAQRPGSTSAKQVSQRPAARESSGRRQSSLTHLSLYR
jgi:hypothetical protein